MIDGEEPAGAGGGGGDDTPEAAAKQPVPYERFAAVVAERKALRSQVAGTADLQAKLDAATKRATDAEAALASGRQEWEERSALWKAGVDDDDGIDVARTLYGRLPADKRPTMSEWIAGLKAEGATVPKPLAPYLAQQQPAAAPAKAQPKPGQPQAQPPSAAGRADETAIRTARMEAHRTGDWSAFKRLVGMT
jgi:hypothetical protein